MRFLLLVLTISLTVFAIKAQNKHIIENQFNDYKVNTLYNGPIKPVDIKTTWTGRNFKTRLRESYKTQGLNFAGHYCFVYWGCGSPCKMSAIIDLKTGKVYDGPTGTLGYQFQTSSRMVLVNPANEKNRDCEWCQSEIWIWDESQKKFKQKK